MCYLCILAWNLDLVEFAILELRQIMAEKVKRLDARSRLERLFVSVSPVLEALNIFVLVWRNPEEVILVILLHAGIRRATIYVVQTTYPSGAGQIGDHASQIGDRHRRKLPIIFSCVGTCRVTL